MSYLLTQQKKSEAIWHLAERNNMNEKRVVVRQVKKVERLPLV